MSPAALCSVKSVAGPSPDLLVSWEGRSVPQCGNMWRRAFSPWSRAAAAILLLPLVAGCGAAIRSANERMASGVTAAILNQDDIETARAGIPAYLVMLDGMIEGDPGDVGLLLAGARLYGAYASAFVEEPQRAVRLALRAKNYGERALCRDLPAVCSAENGTLDEFAQSLETVEKKDVPVLYGYAAAWAGWVKANEGNWDAIATLPFVEAAMKRVVALDETFDDGGAHVYLGVLDTRLPASLGGKPERGREHFEKAIAISGGKNLMAKVLFAKHYARLVFDRELHDSLVREVLAAETNVPGHTLVNQLARAEAEALRGSADDFF